MILQNFKTYIDWFDLGKNDFQLFGQLFDAIVEQNKYTNTTRILSKENFFIKNILDSLLVTKIYPQLLNKKNLIADIGCGGGFPSLPLAITNPHNSIYSIDSNNKKINAVKQLANNLNLTNIFPLHIRAREAGRKEELSFDFVLARAVAQAAILIKECRQLIKENGKLILFKTPQSFEKEKKLMLQQIKNYKLNYAISPIFLLPDHQGQRIFITIYK